MRATNAANRILLNSIRVTPSSEENKFCDSSLCRFT